MERERQTILSLVALGRITPREAERLLAAWNTGREELWAVVACAVVGLVESLPWLGRLAHMLLTEVVPGLHHAVAGMTYWIGGVL